MPNLFNSSKNGFLLEDNLIFSFFVVSFFINIDCCFRIYVGIFFDKIANQSNTVFIGHSVT